MDTWDPHGGGRGAPVDGQAADGALEEAALCPVAQQLLALHLAFLNVSHDADPSIRIDLILIESLAIDLVFGSVAKDMNQPSSSRSDRVLLGAAGYGQGWRLELGKNHEDLDDLLTKEDHSYIVLYVSG